MHMASLGMCLSEEHSGYSYAHSHMFTLTGACTHRHQNILTSVPITPCDVSRCTFTSFLGWAFTQVRHSWACSALYGWLKALGLLKVEGRLRFLDSAPSLDICTCPPTPL